MVIRYWLVERGKFADIAIYKSPNHKPDLHKADHNLRNFHNSESNNQ